MDESGGVVEERRGHRLLVCAPGGSAIATDQDAVDLIGRTWGLDVESVVVPVERLPASFFDLSTRVAGAVVQKFVDYRLRLVVVGDITEHLAVSSALQAFVRESNRGLNLWFVRDLAELDTVLARVPASR